MEHAVLKSSIISMTIPISLQVYRFQASLFVDLCRAHIRSVTSLLKRGFRFLTRLFAFIEEKR